MRPGELRRELRRAVSWHRRLLAAGLAAASVAFALTALAPPPAPTARVVVASHDLPAGTALRPADLAVRLLPPAAVPAGAVRRAADAAGLTLAAPVRRGEPVTDVRLVGRPLLRALPAGLVAAPVRLADAGAVALLRPGDLVDVLAAAGPAGTGGRGVAAVIAERVRVVTIPLPSAVGLAETDGALVVLAVAPAVATDLAGAAVTSRLTLTLRP